MSWTDDRVATLKKMWTQGKSASEIAENLGGVTRNAVIGKAHRLGLSGRPSPIKAQKKGAAKKVDPKKKTDSKAPKKAASKKDETAKSKKDDKVAASSKKIKPVEPNIKEPPVKIATPEMDQKKLKEGKLITILDLTEKVCRWPIGDPKEGEFGFCGDESDPSHPYCAPHMALAFQSASARKEMKRTQEALAKAKKQKLLDDARKEREEDDELDDIEDIDLDDIDPDAIDDLDDDDLDDEDDAVGL